MPFLGKLALAVWPLGMARGQDLAPRASVITPLRWNAITLTYSYYTGGLQFDGAVPITGATANISVPILTFYHALNFFGRSANFLASLRTGWEICKEMCLGRRDTSTGPACWIRFTAFR